jgi:hypothetical protein
MLDADLAQVYGVSTKRLNQQMLRNLQRFPADFSFRLNDEEAAALRLHFATSNKGRGGRRYRPYAFTEHGAVMLSAVLKTPLAIQASILIARAFVKLREYLLSHSDLARKVERLEEESQRHASQITSLLKMMDDMSRPPDAPSKQIGFHP